MPYISKKELDAVMAVLQKAHDHSLLSNNVIAGLGRTHPLFLTQKFTFGGRNFGIITCHLDGFRVTPIETPDGKDKFDLFEKSL